MKPELCMQLESLQPIPAGSREELALRAAVVVVAEDLSKQMGATEAELNTLLWEYSQELERAGKLPIPHMLVATDKY